MYVLITGSRLKKDSSWPDWACSLTTWTSNQLRLAFAIKLTLKPSANAKKKKLSLTGPSPHSKHGIQQTASHGVSEKPDVLPPSIAVCRKVKVTKAERHIQQCIDAALHKLEEHQCVALRRCGLERIFDGLRATCFVLFQLSEYSTCIIGEDLGRLRQFATRFPGPNSV